MLSQKSYTVVLCTVQAPHKLLVSSYGNTVIHDKCSDLWANSAGMCRNYE